MANPFSNTGTGAGRNPATGQFMNRAALKDMVEQVIRTMTTKQENADFAAQTHGKDANDTALVKAAFDTSKEHAAVQGYLGQIIDAIREFEGNVVELREFIPLIQDINNVAQQDDVTLSKTDKAHIAARCNELVAIIQRKTSLFSRMTSKMKKVSPREKLADKLSEGHGVLGKLASMALRPKDHTTGDMVRKLRADTLGQVGAHLKDIDTDGQGGSSTARTGKAKSNTSLSALMKKMMGGHVAAATGMVGDKVQHANCPCPDLTLTLIHKELQKQTKIQQTASESDQQRSEAVERDKENATNSVSKVEKVKDKPLRNGNGFGVLSAFMGDLFGGLTSKAGLLGKVFTVLGKSGLLSAGNLLKAGQIAVAWFAGAMAGQAAAKNIKANPDGWFSTLDKKVNTGFKALDRLLHTENGPNIGGMIDATTGTMGIDERHSTTPTPEEKGNESLLAELKNLTAEVGRTEANPNQQPAVESPTVPTLPEPAAPTPRRVRPVTVDRGYDSNVKVTPAPKVVKEPTAQGDYDFDAYKNMLGKRESGNNYAVSEKKNGGYLGRYQMGPAALETVGLLNKGASKKHGGNKAILDDPSNWTIAGGKTAFLNNPALQDKAFRTLTEGNLRTLKRRGVVTAGMRPEAVMGHLAASHLVGAAGWLAQNGRADSNGVRGADYFALMDGKITDRRDATSMNALTARTHTGSAAAPVVINNHTSIAKGGDSAPILMPQPIAARNPDNVLDRISGANQP